MQKENEYLCVTLMVFWMRVWSYLLSVSLIIVVPRVEKTMKDIRNIGL